MIQRLQSLWLLIAAVLAFVTLKVPFFSGNILVENVQQYQYYSAMSSVLLMILTVIVAGGALITIFLFKDRNTQWKIALALFFISIVNIVLYFIASRTFVVGNWNYSLTAIVAIAVPIFLLMAVRSIYKDEKLMKSLDRLR